MQPPSNQPFKVCPRCQSPADLNAAQCLHCGRAYRTQFAPPDQTQVLMPPAYPPQAARTAAPHKMSFVQKMIACGCGVPLLFVFLAIFWGSALKSPSSNLDAEKDAAYIQSVLAVQDRLKSPDSMQFADPESRRHTAYLEKGRYMVHSYVNAQNAYGSTLRVEYVCLLHKIGPDKTDWTIDSLTLQ